MYIRAVFISVLIALPTGMNNVAQAGHINSFTIKTVAPELYEAPADQKPGKLTTKNTAVLEQAFKDFRERDYDQCRQQIMMKNF